MGIDHLTPDPTAKTRLEKDKAMLDQRTRQQIETLFAALLSSLDTSAIPTSSELLSLRNSIEKNASSFRSGTIDTVAAKAAAHHFKGFIQENSSKFGLNEDKVNSLQDL